MRRCHILPGSRFALVDHDGGGSVITLCDSAEGSARFATYYVRINGETRHIVEDNMLVASHRADPDPRVQLATYEFQNPSFRMPRDQLMESDAELRAATQGIEDLVGSRIMLLAHQAEVVATVLSDAECRYILADEVGLGKTIEAAVILKGVRRRNPKLQTFILTPASLVDQWYFELDHKFWMRFGLLHPRGRSQRNAPEPGMILSYDQLQYAPELVRWVSNQSWDLLIVDEAHHVPKNPELNDILRSLSAAVPRVLLLSATPVQRRSEEFLGLLKLLHPQRYAHIEPPQFRTMLAAQLELLQIVARVAPDLTSEYFDPDYFCMEMDAVLALIQNDAQLAAYIRQVHESIRQPDKGLSAAKIAVSYISENYRLERRVIRNRRANLTVELPTRALNEGFAYSVGPEEASVLSELHEYADNLLDGHAYAAYSQEAVRIFFHAAFSSPPALLTLVRARLQATRTRPTNRYGDELTRLTRAGAPRNEAARITELLAAIPAVTDEDAALNRLLWVAQQWEHATELALNSLRYREEIAPSSHRLIQVVRAVDSHFRQNPNGKIVIFTHWLDTLRLLVPNLRRRLGREQVFEFHIGLSEEQLQEQVVDFQEANQGAVLVCDELGGEGRNFQVADLIIHVDLPWAPAQLEQRIGRVDRLGRTGIVTSVIPYVKEQLEEDLFQIWQRAFELFTRSMSGMEIVLEGVQDELMASLAQGTRDSFRRALTEMTAHARSMREQVEEERYYEAQAINHRRREEFVRISERYRDGSVLREPLQAWATQAGLKNNFDPHTDTVSYYPTQFSQNAMANAKFAEVPNMEDALARSRRASSLKIEGTFNRSVAVIREDLVFYAPGSDPWTDAIIRNAIEADRGRCCAIQRYAEGIAKTNLLFDFTYRVQVDPRPLLALGHDPIHLLRAQGYVFTPTYRLLINHNGKRLARGHALVEQIKRPFSGSYDIHVGKRSGSPSPIGKFIHQLPSERWHQILHSVFEAADKALSEEFAFLEDVANDARDDFEQTARGMRAAGNWYISHGLIADVDAHWESIRQFEEISQALVVGLQKPCIALESVCCWVLSPAKA